MPTLPIPQENKQLTKKKFTFSSPLLVGLLILFIGLGTYAILRSQAATTVPTPADGTTWKIHIVGDSVSSGCDYWRPKFVGLTEGWTVPHDLVGTFKGEGQIGENNPCGVSDDDSDSHGAWCSADNDTNGCQRNITALDTHRPIGALERISDWTATVKPDISFIQFGANDDASGFSADVMISNFTGITDKIRAVNPDTAVFLSSAKTNGNSFSDFNAKLKAFAEQRFAQGQRVYFIDTWAGVTEFDQYQTHPIGAGADKFAANLFDAVKKYTTGELPQPDAYNNENPTPTTGPTSQPTTGPTPIASITPVPQPTATTNAVLTMNSSTTNNLQAGQTFTVQLKINSKVPFNAFDASLVYPADKLELVTTDINSDPAPDPAITLRRFAPNALPAEARAPGNLPIVFMPIGEDGSVLNPMAAGDYTIMNVTFKALAATGTATIGYNPNVGVSGPDSTAKLLEAAGSWVVGFGSGGSNPTPTTNPTGNPTPTTQPTTAPTPTTVPQDKDANFYLTVNPTTVQQNGTVTVTIHGNFKQTIPGGEIHLKYDPSQLQYVSSTETDGLVAGEKMITTNDNGLLFMLFVKTSGLSGDHGLINVTFKALANSGSTQLSFAPETVTANMDGQELSESLGTAIVAFGTGGSNPTPTPQPTGNPTPNPTGNPTPNPTANPTPVAGTTSFYFTAGGSSVNVGDTITVTLHGNFAKAVNAGEMHITYDSSKLQQLDVVPTGGLTASDLLIKTSSTNLTYLVFTKIAGLSGDVPLATMTFKAIAGSGTSTFGLASATALSAADTNSTITYTTTPLTIALNTPNQPPAPTPLPLQPTPPPRTRSSSGGTRTTTGSTLPSSTRPVDPTQPAPNTPSPTPAPGTGTPTRIVATNISRNSATITWSTGLKTTGVVEYGTTSAYGFQVEDKNLDLNHSVTLSPQVLIPGTTFHYRIKAIDEKGTQYVSGDQTFKTKGYSVVVEVKDSANKAVKGATVAFGADLKASTDAAGKASFPDAPGGSVQVKVTFNNQTTEKTVTVQDSAATQTFSIQLAASQAPKKKTSIWVPIIIITGIGLLIGLIILGIRYIRGNSGSTGYYDTVVPNTYGAPTPPTDPNQLPPQAPGQPGQAAGTEGRHEYPW